MQVFNPFQEVYDVNAGGAAGSMSVMSVFNMSQTNDVQRQSEEWLEENFFDGELKFAVTELLYQHKGTGGFVVLDKLFGTVAKEFHTCMDKKMRNRAFREADDTDTWAPE
jgi:hypothetical protein